MERATWCCLCVDPQALVIDFQKFQFNVSSLFKTSALTLKQVGTWSVPPGVAYALILKRW